MNPKSESEPLVSPIETTDQPPPPAAPAASNGRRRGGRNMLPERDRRSPPERLLVRLIATCGIVGIGVAISAIMHSSGSQGWMIGLVVSIVSVVLAAVLWSSRVL
jgi:protein-S-isoprenylcysteine O-methyltransferase Ste14